MTTINTQMINRYFNHFVGACVAVICDKQTRPDIERLIDARENKINCSLYDVESISDINASTEAVIIALPTLRESLQAHARCFELKNRHIPVVFGLSRDIFTELPGWGGSGLTYGGMFGLIRAFIPKADLPSRPQFAEFGVFDGRTFTLAYQSFCEFIDEFVAFDTFEGIKGANIDEQPYFKDGDYYANIETFLANLDVANINREKVKIVKGDFASLDKSKINQSLRDKSVIVAHIDCDVYESALTALNILSSKLYDSAVLLFDDYDTMWASNKLGERAAVSQWLRDNPNFELIEYRQYSAVGQSFIFHRN